MAALPRTRSPGCSRHSSSSSVSITPTCTSKLGPRPLPLLVPEAMGCCRSVQPSTAPPPLNMPVRATGVKDTPEASCTGATATSSAEPAGSSSCMPSLSLSTCRGSGQQVCHDLNVVTKPANCSARACYSVQRPAVVMQASSSCAKMPCVSQARAPAVLSPVCACVRAPACPGCCRRSTRSAPPGWASARWCCQQRR